MVSAILLAAGSGKRLKMPMPKPLVKAGSQPIIIHSLKALDRHPAINEIIIVASITNRKAIAAAIKKHSFKKIKAICFGGRRRQDSVRNGLKEVSLASRWILIHDSARPFIGRKFISEVISAAKKTGAAIIGVPVKSTIKSVKTESFVDKTISRSNLWEIQTPQVFKKELIADAYRKYSKGNVTDDASLVEKSGRAVKVVMGSYKNIKITTREDLLFAGFIAERKAL